MTKNNFAGVPFTVASPAEAVRLSIQSMTENSIGVDIHLLNAYSVALAQSIPAYKDCVLGATYNFPDGKPIGWFSRRFGAKLHQVRGPQFFEDVLDVGRDYELRHFFLGSSPETLNLLKSRMEAKFEGLQIVGIHSPPFRPLTADELVEQDELLRATSPDVIWVGLGTPKQDYEVRRLAKVGFVAAAVGAAFDFSAGTKKTSPAWMNAIGLEWLYRLLTEPGRLWKRYLWGNTVFLRSVIFGPHQKRGQV